MKGLYIFGVVVAVLAIANCAPFFDDEFEKLFEKFKINCSEKFNCPTGSSTCSKNTTTSADRKTIRTEIKCFNADGQLLNSGDEPEIVENSNPNGIHNSYVYYGSFSGGSNTVHTTNVGNSKPTTNTNVETFE